MEYIRNHWLEIMAITSFLHVVAKLIVGLTPNPKDNVFLEKAVDLIKKLVSIIGLQPPIHTIITNNTAIKESVANPENKK